MACTDTGLKTCDRPAVFTLKPLERKRRRRKISLRLDGDEQSGDVNTHWTRLAHGTFQDTNQWNIPPAHRDRDNVNRSARTVLTHERKMHVIHSSDTGGQ